MSLLVQLRQAEDAAQTAPVDLTFLLDNSGSMMRHVRDVVRAYRRLLDEQHKAGGNMNHTLALFDDHCAIGPTDPIGQVGAIDYHANGGSTALNDAIVETVEATTRRLFKGQPSVVVIIVTDGHENASKRSVAQACAAVVAAQARGWKFIYVGANQNAAKEASKYGIPPENALTFAQRSIGFSRAFRALSANLLAFRRSQGSLGFSEDQRREQRLLLNERNP